MQVNSSYLSLFAFVLSLAVVNLSYAVTPTPKPKQGGKLLELTVSGKDGKPAMPGYSFSPNATNPTQSSISSYFTQYIDNSYGLNSNPTFAFLNFLTNSPSKGRDGRTGGNAGLAEDGQPAGQIDLKIKGDGTGKLNGVVFVTGDIRDPNRGFVTVNEQLNFNTQGYIYLYSNGGRGGLGGTGGDGEAGKKGSKGTDATQYTWGGNGGDGGNGGNGGRGTSGGAGGNAGEIKVQVNENETGLLMLVKTQTKGGSGGEAGKHGRGGEGGPGGDGGNSYSWTEYYDDTETYTDSDGNTQTRTVQKSRSHYNPGGSSGSSGSSGSTPTDRLTPGKSGKDGRTKYFVTGPVSTTEYNSMYDLRLIHFDFDDSEFNGIFEPGETVKVKKIRVKNVGEMPTPKDQPIKVYLSNQEWVLTDGTEFRIPKQLLQNEEFEIPVEFKFKIKNTTIHTDGARFVTEDTIRPLASVTQVDRLFEEFDNPKVFQITYPVEITPIETITSLAPGQKTKIFWKVKNVSTKDMGLSSEFKRKIMSMLSLDEKTLPADQIRFLNEQGKIGDIVAGVQSEVPVLKPEESFLIEGTLQVGEDAKPFTQSTVRVGLSLDSIDGSGLNRIQNQAVQLNVVQTYKRSRDPGILLVINNQTDAEQITTWKKLASDLGLSLDVWDLSYYGQLKLTERLKEAGSTLAEDFKGKTVVLLNNEFENAGRKIRSDLLLARSDFLQALGSNGTRFLAVGGQMNSETLLKDYLLPLDSEGKTVSSLSDVFKNAGTQGAQDLVKEGFETVEISKVSIFGKPKLSAFKQKAAGVQTKLSKLDPTHRYVVVYHFDPKLTKSSFLGTVKNWNLGKFEIRRVVGSSLGMGVSLELSDAVLKKPDTILSPEMKVAFMSALSPELKGEILAKAISSSDFANKLNQEQYSRTLIRSLLADITAEQIPLRRSVGRSVSEILNKSTLLSKLAFFKPSLTLNPTSSTGRFICELIAELHVMSSSQVSWWQQLIPWNSNRKTSKATRLAAHKIFENFFEERARKDALREIGQIRKNLRTELKNLNLVSQQDKFSHYIYPAENRQFTFGASLLSQPGDGVMSQAEFDKILLDERSRFENSEDFEKLFQAERCNLIVQ